MSKSTVTDDATGDCVPYVSRREIRKCLKERLVAKCRRGTSCWDVDVADSDGVVDAVGGGG